MIVRFGIDFDGMLPDPLETRIGYVVAGPALFLSILETQLGIIANTLSQGERIVQYRGCLKEVDRPSRFFHRSFAVDELGVAKALLHWRDTWYWAGWQGTFPRAATGRLQDMADVEALAREVVAPSFGQRLAVVLQALEKRRTQIEAVELVDPPEDYPFLWCQVLSKFRTIDTRLDEIAPGGKPGSDLALLQEALISTRENEDGEITRIALSGDGSVLVLKAGSRAVSARLLAEYLKTASKRGAAVVTGGHGYELDEALESVDLPRCGFQPLSKWRPPLQILPLALGLLWKPLDPVILSQFLNLPMAPLPRRVRSKLASVVVEYPGIGGQAWQEAVAELLASQRADRGADEKKQGAMATAIEYWLMPERFDQETGAVTAVVAERCQKVADYLATRVATAEDETSRGLFASAHRQAVGLARAADDLWKQGAFHIPREQLGRLITFTAGAGSPLAGRLPEVWHVSAGETPAVFATPRNEVIWWDLSMPGLPSPYPWSKAEMDTLRAHGVHLVEIERELQRLARTWLRPIRCVQQRLILVLHQGDENQHPVWDRISTACQGWVEHDIESFSRSGEIIPELKVKASAVAVQSLPPLRRWWQLPDGRLLAGRETESFTSLDDFVKSPYKWVLKHKAKLYAGRLDSPASGNLLKGSLIHRLIELFFKAHIDWHKVSEKGIVAWIDNILPQLLEAEGATLLAPGMTVEKEQFRETAQRALSSLVTRLKRARISDIRVEHRDTARFFGGELVGYIDMLLVDDRGKEAIIDVKWGGYRYREEDLRQNRSLQLAVYAFMRKTSANLAYWPAVANFIIDGARLLTSDEGAFPGAVIAKPESGEDVSHLWQRFEATWRWRRAQFDRGLVEVTVTGTEPTEESVPPESAMALESANDQFNDYAVLTGWGADR